MRYVVGCQKRSDELRLHMFSIRKIFNQHLYYEFSPTRELRVKLIERPGRWMADDEWQSALQDVRTVVEQCETKQPLDYGVQGDDKNYFDNAIITVVYDAQNDRPIAFNAMYYMHLNIAGQPHDAIHLGLVMVDPQYRSRGLTWVLFGLPCVLLFFRNLLQPIWISNVTQVPAAFGLVCNSYDNVFPNSGAGARRSFQHVVIADQVIQNYRFVFGVGDDAVFDRERFVITNAYTGGSDGLKKSFAETSKHRNSLYNEICERELDYERGDDFLQIGQLNLTAIKHYLLHDVPRRSLLAIIYHTGFLLVSAILLPAVRWFNSNVRMGELRPWKTK